MLGRLMMNVDRLSAPRAHQGLLVEPGPAALLGELRSLSGGASSGPGAAAPAWARADLLDTSVGALRSELRGRLGLGGPVILTGHQAEFFHAGVFVKSIAAAALASAGGESVYLTVDSDVPKSAHVAAPVLEASRGRRRLVPIPGCEPHLPMSEQPQLGADAWRPFFAELRAAVRGLHGDTALLDAYERGGFGSASGPIEPCAAMEAGNEACESMLGLRHGRRVRVTELAGWPEFRALVAHLALEADRFRADYNAAQQAYRERHGVRAPQRPVPPLAADDGRVELPFWLARPGAPRRRMFVARRGAQIALLADGEQAARWTRSELADWATSARRDALAEVGWRVYPRALTLSLFCRMFVCDLFIHGIGGARYDEMTDDFAQRFWGAAPPPIACVTATLLLPLPDHPHADAALRAAQHALRDAHYNPQRRLRDLPAEQVQRRIALIDEQKRLAGLPDARAERERVYREIRALNDALVAAAAPQVAQYRAEVERAADRVRESRVARDREFFYALHQRVELERLAARVRDALEPAAPSPQQGAGGYGSAARTLPS